jgi:hypothetical protein
MKGSWDSIHVVEVQDRQKNAHYKLTSTVMLNIETETPATGNVSLAGSLTRQVPNHFEIILIKFIRKREIILFLMLLLTMLILDVWSKVWKTSSVKPWKPSTLARQRISLTS